MLKTKVFNSLIVWIYRHALKMPAGSTSQLPRCADLEESGKDQGSKEAGALLRVQQDHEQN